MDYFRSKKFRLLLAMLSLLLLTNVVQESYAKYISSASANSNFSIAQWTFKVNSQDVLNDGNFTNTIVPVVNPNENIRDGYIAPTSTGYFDIIVDYSEVGVSFNNEITLTPSNSLTDLVITGYKLNEGEVVNFENGNYTLTTNHNLADGGIRDIYRFYVEWKDGDNETMDNEDDTEASKSSSASVGVNLRFIQVAN